MSDILNRITSFVEDVVSPIGQLPNIVGDMIGETRYPFGTAYFPDDLGSEYIGHYMTVSMFIGGSGISTSTGPFAGGPQQNVFNFAIFMPSDIGGGTFPLYTDSHEYADVKLSNILTDAVGIQTTNAAGMARRAINPGVQVLYRSTQLRTFEFSFLMAPRTESESVNMNKIIKNVRALAAPQDGGLIFESPAEIEIKFMFRDQNGSINENKNMPKLKRCVITNIQTNFAPQGVYSTFTNGHPVSCMFSFTVREMEIITRAMINDGNGGY